MKTLKLNFRPSLIGILSCLVAMTATAQARQQPASPQSDSPLMQAQGLIAAGKPDAAIALLKSLPASGGDALADHLLGLAYYQKGEYPVAVEHLSIAIKRADTAGKQYRQGVHLLGLAQFALGRIREAIPYLEQASNWSPDNIEMAYTLGVSYAQTHNLEKAREAFARMFGVPAASAPAHLINAKMLTRLRFEEFAEKELQKALEMDPKLPQANFLMGELAIYRAQIDLGIELLKKEIALNPGFAMAYYRLGEAYSRQLKWDEAIAPLLKSISLNLDFSGSYLVLGKVYWKKGELQKAEGALRSGLKMDPNNYSGHHMLAQVLQQSDRPDEARKEFEIAERLRSSSDK